MGSSVEHEALVCPVCGAPYREVIPADVVHVNCRYCGGTIVVPASAPRCPNHPNVFAMSVCNDCGRRYCSDCLSDYVLEGERERGVLRLCPNCLTRRHYARDEYVFLFGALLLVLGIFFLFAEPTVGVLWIALFALPVMVYGLYKIRRFYRSEDLVFEAERPRGEESQKPSIEIYQGMLTEYTRSYGMHGSFLLENRLKSYMRDGLSRDEALRKMAKEEGYD